MFTADIGVCKEHSVLGILPGKFRVNAGPRSGHMVTIRPAPAVSGQCVALLPNFLMDVQLWQEADTQIPTVAPLLVHKGNICNESLKHPLKHTHRNTHTHTVDTYT